MRGIRILQACAATVLALLCLGCSRGGKVIPRSEMVEIYADLLIADQWLEHQGHHVLKASDTTMFYEPVFKSHGYSTQDFRRSVYRYLDDPQRYAKLLKKVEKTLQDRADALAVRIGAENDARAEYAHWKSIYVPMDFYYPSLLGDTLLVGVSRRTDSLLREPLMPLRKAHVFVGEDDGEDGDMEEDTPECGQGMASLPELDSAVMRIPVSGRLPEEAVLSQERLLPPSRNLGQAMTNKTD